MVTVKSFVNIIRGMTLHATIVTKILYIFWEQANMVRYVKICRILKNIYENINTFTSRKRKIKK